MQFHFFSPLEGEAHFPVVIARWYCNNKLWESSTLPDLFFYAPGVAPTPPGPASGVFSFSKPLADPSAAGTRRGHFSVGKRS